MARKEVLVRETLPGDQLRLPHMAPARRKVARGMAARLHHPEPHWTHRPGGGFVRSCRSCPATAWVSGDGSEVGGEALARDCAGLDF